MKKIRRNGDRNGNDTPSKELIKKVQNVSIPTFKIGWVTIPIKGVSPLIMHKFSEKTKKQMLDKHMKKAQKQGREVKDPVLNVILATHFIDGPGVEHKIYKRMIKDDVKPGSDITEYFNGAKVGFPVNGFKIALISACRQVDGLTMAAAKGMFFMEEDYNGLVEIKYESVLFKEDYVRTSKGTPDIRHRPAFYNWSSKLKIKYNPMMISPEQLASLTNLAGFCSGVGDWRPSSQKPGSNGMWTVV